MQARISIQSRYSDGATYTRKQVQCFLSITSVPIPSKERALVSKFTMKCMFSA